MLQLCLVKRALYAGLNISRELKFDILADFSTVNAMTIAHCEKMCSSIFPQVRHHQILILIDFVRVFW